ncbi:MAG: SRPBCC family protein [Micromonosporaceae bacterium]
MSVRTITHASFVVTRSYPAPPARVFTAFADPKAKNQWFLGPDTWERSTHQLDFRVGGRERLSGGPASGPVHTYQGRYQDIVPDERIVLTYEMHLNETRASVSLATLEFTPTPDGGTRLVYTEQGAFLDGIESPTAREQGTADLLNALGEYLRRSAE